MPAKNQPSWRHSNRYSAEAACAHCEGVIRHESWCNTQSPTVYYAYQAVSHPSHLNLGDHLILHALGVAWVAEKRQSKIGGKHDGER